MTTAYLTIDDGPSTNTPFYLDYLATRGITPVLFFSGRNLQSHWTQALDVVQRGALVGNHGHDHVQYSELTLEACIDNMERQEALLDKLYMEAGVHREHKLMRFPYGDKGGKNETGLQQYLRDHGFSRLDDRSITHAWYHALGWGRDMDAPCTFDLQDYRLHVPKDTFTYDDILRHIADRQPEQGGSLYDGTLQIIRMHDLPATESAHPGYFSDLVERLQAAGVRFIKPRVYQP